MLIGNSCVSKTIESLNKGGFDLAKEAMPTNPQPIIILPHTVQELIEIIMFSDQKIKDKNPRVYDVTNEIKKQ